MRLTGRVAIVTGAGRGIGRAIALLYAREGAKVVLAARNERQLQVVSEEIAVAGGVSLAATTDVRAKADTERMARQAVERFGRIDILVNNAGVARHNYILDVPEEDYDLTFDVNMKGIFLCTQAVLPRMMEQRAGRIINISSGAGLRGSPRKSVYSASKFAVIGFSDSLAQEVGQYGIAVNVICPGPVATDMRHNSYPLEDPALLPEPGDVADLALFLASDEARTIHNAVIRVAWGPHPIPVNETVTPLEEG